MTIDGDYLVLSTGRRVYAHGGIVGLDTHTGAIMEGWDGGIYDPCNESANDPTPIEIAEICEYMRDQWHLMAQYWTKAAEAGNP